MKAQISTLNPQNGKNKLKSGYLKPFILLVLLAASLALFACGSDDPEKVRSRGRSLEVHTSYPLIVEKVAFMDSQGQHRVIRPRASNRQLVLLDITLVNRTSLITPLLIDEEAAQIGDRRGERIDAIDPFESSRVVDAADPDEDLYSPFLWGQIELDKEFQVEGYMIFDVPKGLILGSLWWEEVDAIITDFVDYRRRR